MEAKILAQLNLINQQFYQNFADSFSKTRQRIQPGVSRILESAPRRGNFLDIGCGNGNLGYQWVNRAYEGTYCGIDFSEGLINAARNTEFALNPEQNTLFFRADLTAMEWTSLLPELTWDTACCFAVLHHIPGKDQREQLCSQIRGLLEDGKPLWVSVWQPLNSPRLSKRIHGWDTMGIAQDDVEVGDVLMDWRAHKGKSSTPALRFVHIFTDAELSSLAIKCGFSVKEQFLSDGKEGNLGLYQKWIAN